MRAGVGAALLLLAGCSREAAAPQASAPGAASTPKASEPTPEERELRKTASDAVAWLAANQNADGSFGSHHSPRPIEVLAGVPGSHQAFQVATTALVVLALDGCPLASEAKERAADRAIDFLLEHFDVKRTSGMEHYNVWSFGYALHCFGDRLIARPGDPRADAMRAACARLVEKLGTYQTLDGGWGYLSLGEVPTFQPSDTSMSFTTATILVGVERAMRAGIAVPEKLVARAVDHIQRSRLPDGAYLYGEYLKYMPRHGINENKGSACRTPLCDYTLKHFGVEVTQAEFEKGLDDLLFKHARFQRMALRRPIPHESWYSVSGYFYLYGHAYAAYAIEELPRERQAKYWAALVERTNVCREPDGSYWDYPLYSYHKPYGTAFALIALSGALKSMTAAGHGA